MQKCESFARMTLMQTTSLKPQTTSLKPQKVENRNASVSTSIEKMFEAGAHYGYGKSRRHPSVSSFKLYKELGKIDKDVLRISGKSAGIEPVLLEKPRVEEGEEVE